MNVEKPVIFEHGASILWRFRDLTYVRVPQLMTQKFTKHVFK